MKYLSWAFLALGAGFKSNLRSNVNNNLSLDMARKDNFFKKSPGATTGKEDQSSREAVPAIPDRGQLSNSASAQKNLKFQGNSVPKQELPSSQKRSTFYATTISGLEQVLLRELRDCGAERVVKGKNGVYFEGDANIALRAVMHSRTALRVMEKVVEGGNIRSRGDLYELISSVDWTALMRPEDTLKCDTTLGEDVPEDLRHTHFCSLNIKNAICDQFRERSGSRPTVDIEDPDLPLLLYLHRGTATLYRVWSGESSMHKRGYRNANIHKATLRETTAAALVLMSGWNHRDLGEVLCDPMCGSGTIAIEAALIQAEVAPGLIRYGFNSYKSEGEGDGTGMYTSTGTDSGRLCGPPSSRWKGIPSDLWDRIYGQALAKDKRGHYLTGELKPSIIANDIHKGSIELAIRSAGAARVHRMIDFSCRDISDFKPRSRPNIIVTNPPWDLRLEADDAWGKLGKFSREESAERSCLWALTGNPYTLQSLGMPVSESMSQGPSSLSSQTHHFRSAAVNLQFAKFDLRRFGPGQPE